MLKADQQRVRALLTETVALLCKNGLNFKSELCIEGLIGVTLDCEEIFLVNIKETIKLNSPASSNESNHARATVEPTPSSRKARQQQTICAEISSQTATDCTPLSTKPKQSLATSNFDDASISGRDFGPPAVPSSAKSQLEDAALVSLSGAGVVTEHPVSFHDFPIKLDSALGSKTLPEDAFQPSEAHPNEPAQKRQRTQPQRRAAEKRSVNKTPPTPKMPSRLSSSNEEESANVVEIKEESLSDEELTKNSATDYTSYDDYRAMTTYGVGDLESSQMFGESSFKAEAMFHEEMQAQAQGEFQSYRHPTQRSELQSFCCSFCDETYSTSYSLKRHVLVTHQKRFRFNCPICGKGVQSSQRLQGHMSSNHNMPKAFKCEICNAEIAHKDRFKEHMRKHQMSC